MNATQIASILIILIAVVLILDFTGTLLIPFVLAVFIWFFIKGIRQFFMRSAIIRKWVPTWVLNIVASAFIVVFAILTVNLLTENIQTLSKSLNIYEANITAVANRINEKLNSFENFENFDLFQQTQQFAGTFDFSGMLTSLFSSLTSIFSNAFTILLYILFLFLEEAIFSKKLIALYPDKERYQRVSHLINRIEKSIEDYISLKTIVSILTGFLSFIALYFIGIDAPIFWAFIIFVLNFIPTIGSLIATLFPALFAVLQFGDISPGILTLIIVGAIQLIIGNLVEPRLMGNSLNISALVVLISLAFWGFLWGIPGMILSVPITVVMIIVFSEFPSTKPIAILLSENGHV